MRGPEEQALVLQRCGGLLPDTARYAVEVLKPSAVGQIATYLEALEGLQDSIVPTTEEQAHRLNEDLAVVHRALRVIDEAREAHLRPLNDERNAVIALCKSLTARLSDFKASATRALGAWTVAQNEAIDKAKREAEEAVDAAAEKLRAPEAQGDGEGAKDAEVGMMKAALVLEGLARKEPLRGILSASGVRTAFREEWTLEVVAPEMVPEQYLKPPVDRVDHVRLRAAVKAGERTIPGVNIYQVQRARVSTS